MAEIAATLSSSIVWAHGRLLPAGEAQLPVDDWGALYGLGFFETFRTNGGHPHHWQFHRARLEQACATAGIVVPPTFLAADETRLRATIQALLRENKISDAVFRYTLTAGSAVATSSARNGTDFRAPAEFLTWRPLPPVAPPEGIALRVLQLSRDNGEWLPRPKSLNYANAIVGARELQRRSSVPSDEGLFLSREGFVIETPRQNLLWWEKGEEKFFSPDPSLGAVAGTALQWLRSFAPKVESRQARLPQFLQAEAIIVVNAVRGITPVRVVWDVTDTSRLRTLDSSAHPAVVKLQQAWRDALCATAAFPS